MVTTIQLNEVVKVELDKLKSDKETYEQVILNLLRVARESRLKQEGLLIEGYKEMAGESLKICEEFKYADAELDWEWNEDVD